jgi:hypothetical protein
MSAKYAVTAFLHGLIVGAALLWGEAAQAHAAVVVSSKLSSESAMIGQMIRMLLNASSIPTVEGTDRRRDRSLCRIHRQCRLLLQHAGGPGVEGSAQGV